MNKSKVLGIEYNNVTIGQAAKEIFELECSGKGGYVVTPNAEIAYYSLKNEEFYNAVTGASYILPDGAGVVLASKICGNPLVARAAGYDVSKELLSLMSKKGKRLYLLGSNPGIAEKAAENMKKSYPGLIIAGMHHGYFKDDEKVIDGINKAEPDAVFVALGSPRQELFMQRNRDKVKALMLGLGGSLDVYAGEVKRAPEFFIKFNLEWFYRLLKQPWRIGRMMKLPAYVLKAVSWSLAGREHR